MNTIPLLTPDSPCLSPPAFCQVHLWPHQQAMLAKAVEIEANRCFATATVMNKQRYQDAAPVVASSALGVLMDPPGSGKTYVILSLIAAEVASVPPEASEKPLNLIFVPQNIFVQWRAAIETIFPPGKTPLRYKFCNSYADITNLYNKKVQVFAGYDIVLINDAYMEAVAQTLNDCSITPRRVIVDEIDSIQNRMYTPVQAEQVWLVSASFRAGVTGGQNSVGPYMFQDDDIPYIFCKCEPAFVEQTLQFDQPAEKILVCEDKEIALFRDVFSDKAVYSLNTGVTTSLFHEMDLMHVNRGMPLHEAVQLYIERAQVRLADIETYTDETEYEDDLKALLVLKEKVNKLRERLVTYVPSHAGKTKKAAFGQLVQMCKRDSDKKWLIFNDNFASLAKIYDMLVAANIPCSLLDGGSPEKVADTIRRYKQTTGSEAYQVLLLNSMLEGAGLNLEATDVMVFTHKTEQRLKQQVVGRAQRWGRRGTLQILHILNENELTDDTSYVDKQGVERIEYHVENVEALKIDTPTHT